MVSRIRTNCNGNSSKLTCAPARRRTTGATSSAHMTSAETGLPGSANTRTRRVALPLPLPSRLTTSASVVGLPGFMNTRPK